MNVGEKMTTNEKINIEKFVSSIDSMVNSKYILIDRKIAEVLLSIAECRAVYNTIAECMVNFDFKSEWDYATKGKVFKLPETDEKKISFIFCMLNNIDDKNIDITAVLDRYFSFNQGVSSYDAFCNLIILEFKNLILKKLNIIPKTQDRANENVASEKASQNQYEVLLDLIRDFKVVVISQSQSKFKLISKEDLIAVLSTFEIVVANREVDYFYSFKVMIELSIKKNKVLKNKFVQLSKIIEALIAR